MSTFVDLNMPVMNGFRFIQSFHSLQVQGKENIKIVVLTSSNNSDDRGRGVGLGIENYVVKPIKALDLVRILR